MLSDVTVDTNIFMHAVNSNEARMAEALTFVTDLLNSLALLVVDEGFNPEEARNRSAIWSEYVRFIPAQSFSSVVLATLAASGRITEVAINLSPANAKVINQNIRDRTDRVFIKAALASVEKVLVTHDEVAFRADDRPIIRKKLGVQVSDAQGGATLLI